VADRLTRINLAIADERQLYLTFVWQGQPDKAAECQRRINRLLDLHNYVTAHPTFTTT
jgi:hypothetical protein